MENTIWEGRASWISGITVIDILLSWTVIWLIIPIVRIAKISGTHYRVTDERIIISQGIASRNETEVELYRVKDLAVRQGMIQKMLNVGDITVRSAAGNLEMKGIPNAYALRESMRNSVSDIRKNNNVRVNEAI